MRNLNSGVNMLGEWEDDLLGVGHEGQSLDPPETNERKGPEGAVVGVPWLWAQLVVVHEHEVSVTLNFFVDVEVVVSVKSVVPDEGVSLPVKRRSSLGRIVNFFLLSKSGQGDVIDEVHGYFWWRGVRPGSESVVSYGSVSVDSFSAVLDTPSLMTIFVDHVFMSSHLVVVALDGESDDWSSLLGSHQDLSDSLGRLHVLGVLVSSRAEALTKRYKVKEYSHTKSYLLVVAIISKSKGIDNTSDSG